MTLFHLAPRAPYKSRRTKPKKSHPWKQGYEQTLWKIKQGEKTVYEMPETKRRMSG